MKKPFPVRLSDEQMTILKEIASAEDRSVSATIRRILDEHFKYTTKNSALPPLR
jgi:hypothetical protein